MAGPGQNPLQLPPLPEIRDTKDKNKIEIKYVENDSRRRETLKKRRENIVKKARELQTAVGVDVAVVIFSPGEDAPVVYPNADVAREMCRNFVQLPVNDRVVHMRTHQQLLEESLDKKKKKIQNKLEEIEEKETAIQVYKALRGGDMTGIDLQKMRKMKSMMQKMYFELYPKSSMAQSSAPSAAPHIPLLLEQLSAPMNDNSSVAEELDRCPFGDN